MLYTIFDGIGISIVALIEPLQISFYHLIVTLVVFIWGCGGIQIEYFTKTVQWLWHLRQI